MARSTRFFRLSVFLFIFLCHSVESKFSAVDALKKIDVRAGRYVALGTGIHRELKESTDKVRELEKKVEQLSRREVMLVEKVRQLKAKGARQEEEMKSVYNGLLQDAEQIVEKVRKQSEEEKKLLQEELLAKSAAEKEQLHKTLVTKFEAEKVALHTQLTQEKEKEVAAVRAEMMGQVEAQAAEIRSLMENARESMRQDVARDFEQTRMEFDRELEAIEEKEAAKINLLLVLFASRLEKLEASMEAKLDRAREKLRNEQIRSKQLEKILEMKEQQEAQLSASETENTEQNVEEKDKDKDLLEETEVFTPQVPTAKSDGGAPASATVPTFKKM